MLLGALGGACRAPHAPTVLPPERPKG
jgi:hypothetical protein